MATFEATSGGEGSCCAPARAGGDTTTAVSGPPDRTSAVPTRSVAAPASLPGGSFLMGSEDPGAYAQDGEGPVRLVGVRPFVMERHCVSNQRFAAFVDLTGYVTESEQFGSSFVFAGLLPRRTPATRGVAGAEWWRQVPGASWRRPDGPWSSWEDRADHPVVHVSWNDAQAFCAWAGLRLPTEAEWEYAARGGLEQQRFPWGNGLRPGGEHRMNVWQGRFPVENTAADGYYGTAPVDAFPPNGHGLHNMTGNVWEWTADWFSATWQLRAHRMNPSGPPSGERKALRGGSYLCHASYCWRYRVSARMGNTPDSATGNMGFRCAREAVVSPAAL